MRCTSPMHQRKTRLERAMLGAHGPDFRWALTPKPGFPCVFRHGLTPWSLWKIPPVWDFLGKKWVAVNRGRLGFCREFLFPVLAGAWVVFRFFWRFHVVRHGPHQCAYPPYERPAKKQVQHKDWHGVGVVASATHQARYEVHRHADHDQKYFHHIAPFAVKFTTICFLNST